MLGWGLGSLNSRSSLFFSCCILPSLSNFWVSCRFSKVSCRTSSTSYRSCRVSWRISFYLDEVDLVIDLLSQVIGDLREFCANDPSPWVFVRGSIFSYCLGESSITMGTLVGVLGFPCLILVIFLVLKYKGVFLCLLPFCLIGVLR